MAKYGHYFTSDPDWERYTQSHPDFALQTTAPVLEPIDVKAQREALRVEESSWATKHRPASYGYLVSYDTLTTRDGTQIGVKIYRPSKSVPDVKLPLLFVTHGGGWFEGTYTTEEAWLLWPIFQHFDVIVISVDYRLVPEHLYPTYVEDCWDALQWTAQRVNELGGAEVFLAGSSAGGCLAAVLSQRARDEKMEVKGVILNVPITCHYDHFPKDEYECTSYDQGFGALLHSGEMKQTWDMACPDRSRGRELSASPLLGDVKGLPKQLVFVAGQDPLRDEGIAYGERLKKEGVEVRMHVYQGVPHNFGQIWELEQTKKWWDDMVSGVKWLLK